MLGGIPLLREPPRYCLWQPTDGDGQSFYYVRDVPELLITGREREYFTWYTHIIRAWYSIARHPVGANDDPFRFIKNEAYAPTGIDDDAIDEYVSKFSQPGGLRSMFNICKPPPCFVSPVFESRTWADTSISRSSDGIKRQAEQGSRQKGVGNARSRRRQRGLHRQRVGKQMEQVARQVEYQELKFGHQLAEECSEQLATVYLNFLNAL